MINAAIKADLEFLSRHWSSDVISGKGKQTFHNRKEYFQKDTNSIANKKEGRVKHHYMNTRPIS